MWGSSSRLACYRHVRYRYAQIAASGDVEAPCGSVSLQFYHSRPRRLQQQRSGSWLSALARHGTAGPRGSWGSSSQYLPRTHCRNAHASAAHPQSPVSPLRICVVRSGKPLGSVTCGRQLGISTETTSHPKRLTSSSSCTLRPSRPRVRTPSLCSMAACEQITSCNQEDQLATQSRPERFK